MVSRIHSRYLLGSDIFLLLVRMGFGPSASFPSSVVSEVTLCQSLEAGARSSAGE